jgi:hypothetical protein
VKTTSGTYVSARVRIRHVILIAHGFKLMVERLDLFARTSVADRLVRNGSRLSTAVDRIRQRFGVSAVTWGHSGLVLPQCPDSRLVRRLTPGLCAVLDTKRDRI